MPELSGLTMLTGNCPRWGKDGKIWKGKLFGALLGRSLLGVLDGFHGANSASWNFMDICQMMLNMLFACTCVNARSWNVWPCSQRILGAFGSHPTVMICDGFPMVSGSIQQDCSTWMIHDHLYRFIYCGHPYISILLPIEPIEFDCLSSFPPWHANYHIMPLRWPGCGRALEALEALWHWLALVWLLLFFIHVGVCLAAFDMYKHVQTIAGQGVQLIR